MKKFLTLALSLSLVFVLSTPVLAAPQLTVSSVDEHAVTLTTDGKIISRDLSDAIGDGTYDYLYYKLTVSQDCTVNITAKSSINSINMSMWRPTADGNREAIAAVDNRLLAGTGGANTVSHAPALHVRRDPSTKELGIVGTYKLEKGTYYFRIHGVTARDTDNTVMVSASSSVADSTGEASLSVYVPLKKGATLQLVSSVSTTTWTSSDTSVATVSSSGAVTGVAKGTTTISATAGGKTVQVRIVVTD